MKVKEIVSTVEGIEISLKADWTPKQANCLSKIKRALVGEYEDYMESVKAYDNARIKLVKEFAEKDKDGNPVFTDDNSSYKIVDTAGFRNKYEEKIKPLVDELEEISNKEIDIKFDKFNIDDFPKNCPAEAVYKMYALIED